MKRTYSKILRNRKNRIQRRLVPKNWEAQPRPMFKARNIHYEMSARVQAVNCGGIGAMHLMVQRLGLIENINQTPKLLRVHLSYHESDHVLNLAYNILAGGVRLETLNSGTMTKRSSTAWRRNGFLPRPRLEILNWCGGHVDTNSSIRW